MLPSVLPWLATDSAVRVFPGVWKLLHNSLPGTVSIPNSSVSLFIFYILFYLLLKRMGCLSGCLVSSASLQKLFCGSCSAFKWSFDEFVGEKVVSPSYSSAILELHLVALVFLKKSLVFPILLFSSISEHWSLRKAFLCLLAILWNSSFRWIYLPFLLCLWCLFFSQLFVKAPQTTILPFCISFSWGFFWSLPPVQGQKPPSTILQTLYQI